MPQTPLLTTAATSSKHGCLAVPATARRAEGGGGLLQSMSERLQSMSERGEGGSWCRRLEAVFLGRPPTTEAACSKHGSPCTNNQCMTCTVYIVPNGGLLSAEHGSSMLQGVPVSGRGSSV
jgi:hypothetical protein